MQTQTTKNRPSVVELDRARRSIRTKGRTGLDKLRLGGNKAGTAEAGATTAEIFDRAVRGFEKRV
ncbi:hypothetical protein [Nisaea sp.]|uniref:hypothetical protein n=1 Tax=Nisaea sp. TaxID=2024842 RepID=UPI003B5256B0